MKILINVGVFNGGAPLSILEYAKIAKKYDYEVIAVGEYSKCQEEYHKWGIRTYNIPYFSIGRIVTNITSLYEFIKIIKKEKPDIIHATSIGIVPSKFVSLLYNIPTLYNIAGGQHIIDIFSNEKLIVYSEENKENYKRINYPVEKITVISNRIEKSEDIGNCFDVFTNKNNHINLLMISRFSYELENSINYLLDLMDQISEEFTNVTLKIIGTGTLYEDIYEKADIINQKQNRKIIDLLGYKSNVQDYIDASHIVFGKGRSVIEPILNYRIGVVLSEDSTMTVCTSKTFENLYKFNFSGRNIKNITTVSEFKNLIMQICDNRLDLNELERTREMVDKKYNIKHVERKIISLYEEKELGNLNENHKRCLIKSIIFLLKFYLKNVLSCKKWNEYFQKKIKS